MATDYTDYTDFTRAFIREIREIRGLLLLTTLLSDVEFLFCRCKERMSGENKWEERWHPLREEWVIVAAHRQDRPWSGETVPQEQQAIPPYVDDCYLCPRNARVSGAVNPDYDGVYVFDNDHPCVGMNAPADVRDANGIYQSRPPQGIARVVCYTPRHDQSLAQLEAKEIENLLAAWQAQYRELGSRSEVNHVLVFENKG